MQFALLPKYGSREPSEFLFYHKYAVSRCPLLSLSAGPGCAQPHLGLGLDSNPHPAIVAFTTLGLVGVGYLVDPQRVPLAPFADSRTQLLSGNTRAVIRDAYPFALCNFTSSPTTSTAAGLGRIRRRPESQSPTFGIWTCSRTTRAPSTPP